jgi:hypothetical protein
MSMDVVYVDTGAIGYSPVIHMVRTVSNLLGGKLITFPHRSATYPQKLMSLLPRQTGSDECLFICPAPACMSDFCAIEGWRKRYRKLSVWVFDSFWADYVPRIVKMSQPFDSVFVTEAEDLETWRRTMKAPVEWLPWGADVLRLGSAAPTRPVDLLRIGRQPTTWENDEVTAAECEKRSLRFSGRPSLSTDATENQTMLSAAFSQTKFSLSFTNTVSPSIQTHPTRQYITARWTDALACGVTIAGVSPDCISVEKLFWPGALLELGNTDFKHGLDILGEAVSAWTPARAEHNHFNALEKLDWRLRFETIAQQFGGPIPQRLQADLDELRARVAVWRNRTAIKTERPA